MHPPLNYIVVTEKKYFVKCKFQFVEEIICASLQALAFVKNIYFRQVEPVFSFSRKFAVFRRHSNRFVNISSIAVNQKLATESSCLPPWMPSPAVSVSGNARFRAYPHLDRIFPWVFR